MKNNLLTAFALAGALMLSSCTKKIDEKTMGEITTFGSNWTAMGEQWNTWGTELSSMTTSAKEFSTKQNELLSSIDKIKDNNTKTSLQQLAQTASEDAGKLEQINQEWSQYKSTFDQTTAEYTQWMDKISKGEITPEQATQGLADFNTRYSEAQAKWDTWTNSYNEIKSSMEKNMTAANDMSTSLEKYIK